MILFYITSISDLMIDILLEKSLSHDVLVATPRTEVRNVVKSWGLEGVLMVSDIMPDRRGQDRQFKDDFMPGIFGDATFANTGLPAWQVLSLDRLKFWRQPNFALEVDFLRSLRFSRVYTSFDMGNAIPFVLAQEFETVAVKTEPIRTREVLDFGPHLGFVEYIVSDKEDARFLRRVNVSGAITEREAIIPEPPKWTSKDALRSAMGTPEDVFGILFDPRYERQCRLLFDVLDQQNWPRVYVFPIHRRAAELLPKCLGDYAGKYQVVSSLDALAVCDEIVAFAYDENYCKHLPAKLAIYDPHGLNKAMEIAPEYEVRGLGS